MDPVRLALVGCGKIGQKHLQALVHLPEAALVATVDPDLEQAEAAAVAFDATPYADLEEALAAAPLEAAIIATPSGMHPELARRCLERDLHVLVEKPLALSYREAQAVVGLARRRNRVLAVTHFNRFLPAVSRMLEVCQSGRIGRILTAEVVVAWNRPQSYYEEAAWRGTRAMDGGILFNQAIHALDVLVQAAGPAETAFAWSDTLNHQIETEDALAGAVRFRSGALASVMATTTVARANLEERIAVIGEHGAVAVGPTPSQLLYWRIEGEDEDAMRQAVAAAPSRTGWQSHWEALSDFVAAIRNQGVPALSGESALPVLALVEALTRSGRERRVVPLSEVMAG
ncbi:MAG: Gfo/Idh/MocA family oxidoreductase [Firmicutes bacterium]|nr:Gfo/Idh/MocA family oxidoreductase [Alicyclobacillaceae bacterium]MCL6496265.1 Gfo/Idh/MocA family oxidoreductase [Bacillota bacterium]